MSEWLDGADGADLVIVGGFENGRLRATEVVDTFTAEGWSRTRRCSGVVATDLD